MSTQKVTYVPVINGRFYDPSNQQGGQEDAASQKIQGGAELLIKCLTLPENGFHTGGEKV